MLTAVFILFYHTKASTEGFFSTTLVFLHHHNAKKFDNKSFGFNASHAKPKPIQRTAYHSFS